MIRKKIMARLHEHYETAKKFVAEENIVGVFLVGSQNYRLDTVSSDIDTRVLIAPTIEDFTFARAPLSFEHTTFMEEHINIVDIRLFFQQLKKSNPNTFEILFTDYNIINERFAEEWEMLRSLRERIVRINPVRAVKSIGGSAQIYYDKYKKGKDPLKSVANLLRLEQIMYVYFGTAQYKDALIPSNAELLVDIKEGRHSEEEVADYAEEAWENINTAFDKFIKQNEEQVDTDTTRAMELVLREIIIQQIEFELENMNERKYKSF